MLPQVTTRSVSAPEVTMSRFGRLFSGRAPEVCVVSLLISFSIPGAFAQTSFMIGFSPASFSGIAMSRGDYNNDGIPDVLMGNNSGSNGSAGTVFLGKGDGTFETPLDSGAGSAGVDNTTGEFKHNGRRGVAGGGYV